MALDLNYSPIPLADTEHMTNEEWLELRRKGIGGSDVAAALGLSPYRTARDLYYDKVGVEPVVAGEDKSITFEIGHLLEDVVARIFAKKTGLSIYRDQTMYQHPLFPFMIADVDRFITMPDGTRAILECKTAHHDMQYKWANGAIPRHYELQVRHYMSVMNIDVAFIACLFSNNENDFVWARIDRDLETEEDTILQLEQFWTQNVLKTVEPELREKPDLALEALRRYIGPADPSEAEVTLPPAMSGTLEQIDTLKEEKKDLEAKVRKLETQIKDLYVPIVERMGTACTALCTDGKTGYHVTYNPQYRESVPRDSLNRLKAQHPELYEDYVKTTESRVFRVSRQDLR